MSEPGELQIWLFKSEGWDSDEIYAVLARTEEEAREKLVAKHEHVHFDETRRHDGFYAELEEHGDCCETSVCTDRPDF